MRKLIIAAACVCAIVWGWSARGFLLLSSPLTDEEFVGPFASWMCTRSAGASGNPCGAAVAQYFNAVADGSTDDTTALQNALDHLGSGTACKAGSSCFPNLWVAPGNYKITANLTLGGACGVNATASQLYIGIVGSDPATTKITWGGSSGGTMLCVNAIAYSKFDRITFDGANNASIIIDQSRNGAVGTFDTANEYTDDIFQNAGTAFVCSAHSGTSCSEVSMLRDRFLNNSVAGVALKNFNALDVWVWYSFFQNNSVGMTNTAGGVGAGNFHVFNSIFENSSTADINIVNTGTFNFRNNYSTGSAYFVNAGISNNPGLITIQDNAVLDTTNSASISVGNFGTVLLLDNTIRSGVSATAPIVSVSGRGGTSSDLFSMGNTFTVASPTSATGHYHSIQDQVVSRGSVNPARPTLPGPPPNLGRTIFDAAALTGAAIQTAINSAAVGCSNNVAHIPAGNYVVTATITVPASCAIQIIGDGGNSALNWSSASALPVMKLAGPSKAVLRDFMVSGNTNVADGIEVDAADQSGSRVFMEQSNLASSITNLFVDALDYDNVELHDFNSSANVTAGATTAAVVVTGGSSAAGGTWLGGATNIFAGSASNNYIDYNISNGAHFSARDVFHDAGGGGQVREADISGRATFTAMGNFMGLPDGRATAVSIANLNGNVTLLDDQIQTGNTFTVAGAVTTSGSGVNANLLGIGLLGPTTVFWNNAASATAEFLNGQTTFNSHFTACVGASASGSTCSGTGTTLNVTAVGDGTVNVGDTVNSPTINNGATTIASAGTGTGGVGTYTLTGGSYSISSEGMNTNPTGAGSAELPEIPASNPSVPFLTNMLAQARSVSPTLPNALPAGATDFRAYRVFVSSANNAIHLVNH